MTIDHSSKRRQYSTILDGHVALVTGSSSGIGAAIARLLSTCGATVVVNSTHSRALGNELAASLPRATYVPANIADSVEAANLIDTVIEQYHRLDILVNNAGTTRVIPHNDLNSATPEVWREILDVNVIGTWNVTAAATPHLRRSGHGQVLNISSLAGIRPMGSSIPYACSKAAINHMTCLLASALAPDIRVNAIAPGLVDTQWTADWGKTRSDIRDRTPLQRNAAPEDIAEAAYGLITSRHITGEILIVDGGLHLR